MYFRGQQQYQSFTHYRSGMMKVRSMQKRIHIVVLLFSLSAAGLGQSGGGAAAWQDANLSPRESALAGAGVAASFSQFMGLVNPAGIIDLDADRSTWSCAVATRFAGPWVPTHALFKSYYDINMVAVNWAPKNKHPLVPFINETVLHRTVTGIIGTTLSPYGDILVQDSFVSTEILSITSLAWVIPGGTRFGLNAGMQYSSFSGHGNDQAFTGIDVGVQDKIIGGLSYGLRFALDVSRNTSAIEGVAGITWRKQFGVLRMNLLSDIVSGDDLEFCEGIELAYHRLTLRGGLSYITAGDFSLGTGLGLVVLDTDLLKMNFDFAYNYFHTQYSGYRYLVDTPFKVALNFGF